MVISNSLRLPTPSELYDALTITLGQFSGCEPSVAIHMERLFFPTLSRFGISEGKRKEYDEAGLLYPPKGSPHTPSLWRKFNLAFRYLRYSRVCGESLPRMYQDTSRYYQLTPYGAQVAFELIMLHEADMMEPASPPKKGENLTRLWFHQNWTDMQPRVRAYLAKKLKRSEEMDLCEDHINTFVERAIRRDSFHAHLKAGNKIYPSTLCHFVARSAYTEMRGWGSDGACRALRGAFNERDRRKIKEFHKEHPNYRQDRVHSNAYYRSFRGSDVCMFDAVEDGTQNAAVIDMVGGDLESEFLNLLDMEKMMAQISSVLDGRLPEPEKHCTVFVLKEIEGMTYREIAKNQMIPESRATAMIRKVRKTLHKAVKSGELEMTH